MVRDEGFGGIPTALPGQLRGTVEEAFSCLGASPGAVVRACRSAVVRTITLLEAATEVEMFDLPWHQRINGLVERGTVSEITGIGMHTIFNLRDATEYRGARPSFSDAEACLGLLIAVLRATFPMDGPRSSALTAVGAGA